MLLTVLYRIPNRPKRFGYVAKNNWLLPSVTNIVGLNFTIRHYTIRALCAILRLFDLHTGWQSPGLCFLQLRFCRVRPPNLNCLHVRNMVSWGCHRILMKIHVFWEMKPCRWGDTFLFSKKIHASTSAQNDSRLHLQEISNPRYALLKYLEREDIGRKLYRNVGEYLSTERKSHHKTLDYSC